MHWKKYIILHNYSYDTENYYVENATVITFRAEILWSFQVPLSPTTSLEWKKECLRKESAVNMRFKAMDGTASQ